MHRDREAKDEEVQRLLVALTQAQAIAAREHAEQNSRVALADTTGVHHAAQQALFPRPGPTQ